ncbi:MAG: T9SS type A sorting domain-containing protein [Candidatus Marinimicrobia bacterium]|nr:T9SS type A sorting domain-containing protein [Candidatus Neomarinimicrobiota bacterium]
MMKKLLFVAVLTLLFTTFAMSQVWTYDSDFFHGGMPHGVVRTPDGKIWIGCFGYTDTFFVGNDTLPYKPLWVYNPDGTLDRKIQFLTYEGVTDTIWNSCRGLSLDNDGNVLFTNWYILWRINYQTGEVMNKVVPVEGVSITEAACDENGYIYVAHVDPGGKPIYIYDSDFELYSYVVDSTDVVSRSLVVTPDGRDVYHGRIYGGATNGIIHYHSDDGPEGEYSIVDTFFTQCWAQCLDWDNNGLLWVGSYWDVNAGDLTGWYALDPTQNWAVVDTIGHNMANYGYGWIGEPTQGRYYAPRGIAFSEDGKTAYTADFDGNVIKKWTNPNPVGPGATPITVKIDDSGEKPVIEVNFTLLQNYPNPFNPSTVIPFVLKTRHHVKLSVFDMLGREVKVLVDRDLTPGNYNYTFDASGLPAGVYIYRLDVDGKIAARRMLYVK